ncbi:hypothetical protein [Staphylococcus phage vB_SauH_DELF3]|nr:hypothetical protein [Staphylococcus phage vB_SauH_DELF3]
MSRFKSDSNRERTADTIFEENNSPFIGEKSIRTGRAGPQRLDFYIELNGNKYAIEYMGQQHFVQSTGQTDKPDEYDQELDRVKLEYCEKNDIILLPMFYPLLDKRVIVAMFSEILNHKLEYTEGIKDFYIGTEKEQLVIEFVLNSTQKETQWEFGMTENEVKGLMLRKGRIKRDKSVVGLNIKTLEGTGFDTLKEAQEWLGSAGVRGCTNGTRSSCEGYLWRYEDEYFSEEARTITDKRKKVFEAIKGPKTMRLVLHMIEKEINADVASMLHCKKGNRNTVKGYKIKEIVGQKKEAINESISYIDYIQSYK